MFSLSQVHGLREGTHFLKLSKAALQGSPLAAVPTTLRTGGMQMASVTHEKTCEDTLHMTSRCATVSNRLQGLPQLLGQLAATASTVLVEAVQVDSTLGFSIGTTRLMSTRMAGLELCLTVYTTPTPRCFSAAETMEEHQPESLYRQATASYCTSTVHEDASR